MGQMTIIGPKFKPNSREMVSIKLMKQVVASILMALSAFCSPLFAQQGVDPAVAEIIGERVLGELIAGRPELQFSDIQVTELDGYYRVDVSRGPTLYISEDGDHFFSGELYRQEGGRFVNSTETENAQMRLQQLAAIDDSDKIIFSPQGETLAVLSVFTDVTCTFCRRLHSHIEEFNELGIEIQYLAYPRSGIERNGQLTHEYTETAKAWCAEDPNSTMTALKAGASVPGLVCEDNPVEMEYQLGADFGVTGTPAVVLPNGTLLPGYRTPQDFARILGIPAS